MEIKSPFLPLLMLTICHLRSAEQQLFHLAHATVSQQSVLTVTYNNASKCNKKSNNYHMTEHSYITKPPSWSQCRPLMIFCCSGWMIIKFICDSCLVQAQCGNTPAVKNGFRAIYQSIRKPFQDFLDLVSFSTHIVGELLWQRMQGIW